MADGENGGVSFGCAFLVFIFIAVCLTIGATLGFSSYFGRH
jgi:hypothetical protein